VKTCKGSSPTAKALRRRSSSKAQQKQRCGARAKSSG